MVSRVNLVTGALEIIGVAQIARDRQFTATNLQPGTEYVVTLRSYKPSSGYTSEASEERTVTCKNGSRCFGLLC